MNNKFSPFSTFWSGRLAFIAAATGAAVGLGNIWKFPYITGQNGGGAFVVVYLLCTILVAIPIMVTEIVIGRRGRGSPVHALKRVCRAENQSKFWVLAGWLGLVSSLLILSFYAVVSGWTLAYFVRSLGSTFTAISVADLNRLFIDITGDPERVLAWFTIFILMTMMVVGRGLEQGIERVMILMMPLLLFLLLVMVFFAASNADIVNGFYYLFTPDFSQLTTHGVLLALGHAFFSLSLGVGVMMMYGAYLPNNTSITEMTLAVAVADLVIALLAGLAIFPVVFANSMSADMGPALLFLTVPLTFGHIPGGEHLLSIFFLLLIFAAWSSAIALAEPVVTYLIERYEMSRVRATTITGMLVWILGIGSTLSFNLWSSGPFLFSGMTLFQWLDLVTSNILLPLSGLLLVIFVGWKLGRGVFAQEINRDGVELVLWLFLVRFIAPFAIFTIFVFQFGILDPFIALFD